MKYWFLLAIRQSDQIFILCERGNQMSYGLRRYETIHRLWWFVFFILCLFFAWYSQSFTHPPRQDPELKDLRKIDFWTGLQGIGMTSPSPERLQGQTGPQTRPPGRNPANQTGPGMKKQSPEPSTGQDDFRDNIELVSGMLLFLIQGWNNFFGAAPALARDSICREISAPVNYV